MYLNFFSTKIHLTCYNCKVVHHIKLNGMRLNKKKRFKKATAKILLAGVLSFGAIECPTAVFAQTPPAPQGPPTPPPSPVEVFNKINPFKKNKKTTAKKEATVSTDDATPPQAPPPPPNPLDLFKKKKGATPPPAPSGK